VDSSRVFYSTGNTAVALKNVVDLTQIQQGNDAHEDYLEKFNIINNKSNGQGLS
jgi:hypothetical protein